jgi:hypothetical protein
MNKPLLIATFFLWIISNTYAQKVTQETNEMWNYEIEKQHLLNREDSLTWDYSMLGEDIEWIEFGKETKPFRYGIFPVPKYDLLGEGTFRGMGFGMNYRELDNKGNDLFYTFFYVQKNKLTEKYLPVDKSDEVFFTIIVLSDMVDTVDYSHARNQMMSRNNPDYIGQGLIKTQNDEINYMAFLTAERDEYAIVNMRLFNLKNGRTILIAPQKDGSLRSMQLQSEQVLSAEDIEKYIDEILMQENVKKFFANKNNI